MCEALHEKRIEVLVCPTISASEQICAFHMTDGTRHRRDFDAIVLYTGYHIEFPWLKVKDFNPSPRDWFLHCFPEGSGHCLFFVGYARQDQGGIPAHGDSLARKKGIFLIEE
jgi:dimethylaniline monooxygenase (N-oxide forming)